MVQNKRTDTFWVKPNQLLIREDFNKRLAYGDLQALARSIFENGIHQPLIVEKEKGTDSYFVLSGHRRQKALMLAIEMGLSVDTLIPVIKEFAGTTMKQRLLNQHIHNDGMPFSLLEKGDLFKAAIDEHGMTPKEVAKALGVTTAHVSDCLKLTTVNMYIREQIISGKLAATLVIDEMKGRTVAEVEEELQQALGEAEDGKGITKKDLPKSAGAKDKKVSIADVENLYHEVDEALAGKADPDKLAILKLIGEVLRGTSTFDEFVEFFKPVKRTR